MSSPNASAPDTLPALAHARLAELVARAGARRLLVAFSGGLDSTVLLELALPFARGAGLPIEAIHVDHGLHADSPAWARHCLREAERRTIACRAVRLDGRPGAGESVEAWARRERYAAITRHMEADTCLLTAHHADDQAETVMMRVLTGAGPHGLRAMRELRALPPGYLARPLLGARRDTIAAWAKERSLCWLEDPANRDPRFTRARLRAEVMPLLESMHDGAVTALGRLAQVQGALADDLEQRAYAVLAAAASERHRLPLELLEACEVTLRGTVLRLAAVRAGLEPPAARQVDALQTQLIAAKADAMPVVSWGDNQVRRFRDALYFLRAPPPPPTPATRLPWLPPAPLELPWGVLSMRRVRDGPLASRALLDGEVTVGFRAGGERCRPHGARHRRDLKTLFQEWGVPPWERQLTPLVRVDGELAAIGAHCVCAGFAAAPGDDGVALDWYPALYANTGERGPR